jgi:hypothetical protein
VEAFYISIFLCRYFTTKKSKSTNQTNTDEESVDMDIIQDMRARLHHQTASTAQYEEEEEEMTTTTIITTYIPQYKPVMSKIEIKE